MANGKKSEKKEIIFQDRHFPMQKWNNIVSRCIRNLFDVINISTDKDYVDPLMNYFRKRDKRY